MKKAICGLIAGITLFIPSCIHAHNEGAFFEATVGDYLIDIGYADPVAGEPRTFNFALYKGVEKEKVVFDDVWVRISRDSKTVFAGPIDYGVFGQPVLTITLDTPGIYAVEANYEIAAKSIATTSFSVQAVPREDSFLTLSRLITFGSMAILMLGAFFIGRMNKKYANYK